MNSSETAPPIPRILVIGVGGMGVRDVDFLYRKKMQGLRTLAIDTDRSALERYCANTRVLIGSRLCSGQGCKGDVDCGRTAAQRSRTTIEEQCAGADVILLCAGLGRGTGSGAGPVVADIARKTGALLIGIVTTPFRVCLRERAPAQQALGEMMEIVDSVVIFDNEQCQVPFRPDFMRMFNPYQPWESTRTETMTDVMIRLFLDHSTDQRRLRRIFSARGAAIVMRGEGVATDDMYTLLKNCYSFSCRNYAITGGKGAIVRISSEEPPSITAADDAAIRRAFDLDEDAEILCEWRSGGWNGRTWILGMVTGLREPADGEDPWTVTENMADEKMRRKEEKREFDENGNKDEEESD